MPIRTPPGKKTTGHPQKPSRPPVRSASSLALTTRHSPGGTTHGGIRAILASTGSGYLRVIVNAIALRIEFHPQSDGATTMTPDDVVTVTLATRKVS